MEQQTMTAQIPEAIGTSSRTSDSSYSEQNNPFGKDYRGSDSYYRGERTETESTLSHEFTSVNPFEVLGVSMSATPEEVQAAWKTKVVNLSKDGLTLEDQEALKMANASRDAIFNHRDQLNQIWGPSTQTTEPVYAGRTTRTRQASASRTTSQSSAPRYESKNRTGGTTAWEKFYSNFPDLTQYFTNLSVEPVTQETTVSVDQLTSAQLYRTIIIALAIASIREGRVRQVEMQRVAVYVVSIELAFMTAVGNVLKSEDLV